MEQTTMSTRTIAFALLAALPALALAGCSPSDSSPENDAGASASVVDVAPVERTSIRATLDLVGTLKPIRGTTIVSDVDGVIRSFPASNRIVRLEEAGQAQAITLGLDMGHQVATGDELVRIDPAQFELDLNVAMANLELAKKDLADVLAWRRKEEDARLQAAGREAQAAHEHAQANLRRSTALFNKGTIGKAEHETAVLAARTAEAALARAKAAWELYEAGPTPEKIAVVEARVAAAQAQVDQKQERLDKTIIRAPYDAIICNRFVGVGDRVTAMPRVEIMQLIDPRVLMAEVAVPERYQGMVHLDDVATLEAAGVSEPVLGKVDLVNVLVDPETRTFRVRISIDNRNGLLKAGCFTHVSLPVASTSDVLVVPVEAVAFAEGRPIVFVHENGRVQRTAVALGISNRDHYEVSSGLSAGQMVVVGRTSLLSDGLQIQARVLQAKTKHARIIEPANALEGAPANQALAEAQPHRDTNVQLGSERREANLVSTTVERDSPELAERRAGLSSNTEPTP